MKMRNLWLVHYSNPQGEHSFSLYERKEDAEKEVERIKEEYTSKGLKVNWIYTGKYEFERPAWSGDFIPTLQMEYGELKYGNFMAENSTTMNGTEQILGELTFKEKLTSLLWTLDTPIMRRKLNGDMNALVKSLIKDVDGGVLN